MNSSLQAWGSPDARERRRLRRGTNGGAGEDNMKVSSEFGLFRDRHDAYTQLSQPQLPYKEATDTIIIEHLNTARESLMQYREKQT